MTLFIQIYSLGFVCCLRHNEPFPSDPAAACRKQELLMLADLSGPDYDDAKGSNLRSVPVIQLCCSYHRHDTILAGTVLPLHHIAMIE